MMFGFLGQFRVRIESENPQAIVGAHEDHPVSRHGFSVEDCFRGRTREVPAAVNPQHHGFARFRRPFRSPNIDIETVFAYVGARLHTPRAKVSGVASAGPGFHGQRLAPTQVAHRRRRKGNPLKNYATALESGALNLPSSDCNRRQLLCRRHQSEERQ